MLEFQHSWRFTSPGAIPDDVYDEFHKLIAKVARGQQSVLEQFKSLYAAAAGRPYSRSSSASWAESDLLSNMSDAASNAPLFIEALYDGFEIIKNGSGAPVPDIDYLNNVLARHKARYRIELPYLLTVDGEFSAVTVPVVPLSFDEQAKKTIQESLHEASRFLAEKRERQAVQELLWLLESITTVFEGMTTENNETIQGKYFSKIIPELRKANKGKAIEQILTWMQTLHGFLSAPKGGRIRHGADLKDNVATSSYEATLYYNLILSYMNYLMAEYDRLSKSAKEEDFY